MDDKTVNQHVFELLDEAGISLRGDTGTLDERERRLVIGAATFHALSRPGKTFRLTVLRGPTGSPPALTDRKVHSIKWPDDRQVVGSVVLRSTAHPSAGTTSAAGLTDVVVDVGGPPEYEHLYGKQPTLSSRARRAARFLAPISFDALRQYRTDLLERQLRAGGATRQAPMPLEHGAVAPQRSNPPALLFGLHWLELGGAERWALDTIRMATETGLTPIVVTDRTSAHPWITRPELADAVVVPLTQPLDPGADADFLNGVLANFDVRGIHIHHNTWLYQRLPWLKAQRPDIPVVDSLHILEWRTGGFVDISARLSNVIDVHHVISPALRDYLLGQRGLSVEKVKLATLANLTSNDIASVNHMRGADEPFTVVFVGRFTQQKRPYLFLQLAARLRKSAPDKVRFIMHGDGELADEVRSLRARYGLGDLLEVRSPSVPVARTMAEADVLVISSDNEGLTLTSFEATAAGVPVVSTDVGSQASLVATELLCPRHPYAYLHAAATSINAMMVSAEQSKKWLDEQVVKAAAFARLPDARSFTRELYQGWLR
ncbi:MAG TPA: glycosyltransferase [Pseudonocardiaceae bacterium]